MRLLLRPLITLVLALSGMCFAQGGNFVRQVISGTVANGGTGQPIPYANVRVCPSTATGAPCSPLSPSVYADPALQNPLGNPIAADINAFYSIFLPTGSYLIQESAPIGSGLTYSESFLIFVNGTGTVSYVALSVPTSLFTVTSAPITSSGILSFGLNAQPGNQVFANCTPSSAVPTFCSLTAAMLPTTFPALTIGTLTVTGNETVAGTLGVTGLSTLSSLNVTGLGTLGSLGVTGNSILSGTLNVTGSIQTSGVVTATGSGPSSFTGPVSSPTFNASTGFQIGGTYGTANYFLQSTGSGTTFSPVYYQTIASNGSASTQKPTLNFSQRFTVTPVSSPSETTVDANTPGTGNLLATYLSSPSTSTALAQFDGAGNLAPASAQSNQYVVATSAGQIVQGLSTSGAGSTFSGTWAHTFSGTPIGVCWGFGGSVNGSTMTASGVTGNSSGVSTVECIAIGPY